MRRVCVLCMCLGIITLFAACTNQEYSTSVEENFNTTVYNKTTVAAVEPNLVETQSVSNVSEVDLPESAHMLNTYTGKTNYIFGDETSGFDPAGEMSEVDAGYCYLINGYYDAFMISKTVEEKETEDFRYTIHENGFAEITGAKTVSDVVEVPQNIDGHTVAYIGNRAFTGTHFKKIILNAGILAIGESAFEEMTDLEEVSLPDGLIAVAQDAFAHCENLKISVLPDTVQAIGERAFRDCTNIAKLHLPKNLKYIGRETFCECQNLKLAEAELPNNLKVIGNQAFYNSGIEEVVIPNGIYGVYAGAFHECKKLKKAVFPKEIGDRENGFAWKMFNGCESLEEVTIPENIVGIGSNTFLDCKSLKSIKIPACVESIMEDTFEGCDNLKDIYFESKDCGIYHNSFLFSSGLTVHAPKGGSVEEFFRLRPLVKFVETN